jgi:hypothetical protein
MATINLGNLTFTHKGDYAGGTAYVKNDVVYYATNGNSYIAKGATTGNAPTSTAHWDLFVAGSSGIWNAGLSLGTAGQVVKVNSGANALEFGTIVSKVLQAQHYEHTNRASIGSSSSDQNLHQWTTSFVKQSATSKIYIWNLVPTHGSNQGTQQVYQKFVHSDGTTSEIYGSRLYYYTGQGNSTNIGMQGVASGLKTGTYSINLWSSSKGNNHNGSFVLNPTSSDDNRNEYSADTQGSSGVEGSKSTLIIQEIEV